MADLAINTANVRVITSTFRSMAEVVVGESVTVMQPIYKKAADSLYYKAINSNLEGAAAEGLALTPGSANDTVIMLKSGDVNPGATVTVGESYYVSPTAGGIAPATDVLSGDYVTMLGIGTTASKIHIDITASGVAKP